MGKLLSELRKNDKNNAISLYRIYLPKLHENILGLNLLKKKSLTLNTLKLAYIYIYMCVCVRTRARVCVCGIPQSSKSGIGNISLRTNKLFKFRISKYSW